jgi:glycosyltransferase involved in cell wall biosynthesis
MLAIAVRSANVHSETFVRNHIRIIAPDQTILLCEDERDTEQFHCPVLSKIGGGWRSSGSISARLLKLLRNTRYGVAHPGLVREERIRVLDFFARFEPQAVLAEYGPTGCLLMNICSEVGVPLYVHFHGYDASRLLQNWQWVLRYRLLFKIAKGIISPSRFLADKLFGIGCPEEKIYVSPCGIETQQYKISQRIPFRLLAVGRLVEKKAPHITIAAFGRIAKRYPEATLDIIGDGPLARRCHNLIADLGLSDRVRMHGAQDVDFVVRLMEEAYLFVQHSVTARDGDTEGLGISILEAMASEVPVVATRHNGFVETVVEGVTGLLVNEHDVEGMAAAITKLLNNPYQAACMGAAGRKRVLENFTLEQTRDRLREIMGFPPISRNKVDVT